MTRPTCARPDCTTVPHRGRWCGKHAAQVRRTGSPYRRDELDDAQPVNSYAREMDELLAENPPEIVWAPNGKGVMVAVEIHDPHTERRRPRRAREAPRADKQQMAEDLADWMRANDYLRPRGEVA